MGEEVNHLEASSDTNVNQKYPVTEGKLEIPA